MYIPSNQKIRQKISEKYGIKKTADVLKLFRICGFLLSAALIIKLLVLWIE
jgi:hypothetical protein